MNAAPERHAAYAIDVTINLTGSQERLPLSARARYEHQCGPSYGAWMLPAPFLSLRKWPPLGLIFAPIHFLPTQETLPSLSYLPPRLATTKELNEQATIERHLERAARLPPKWWECRMPPGPLGGFSTSLSRSQTAPCTGVKKEKVGGVSWPKDESSSPVAVWNPICSDDCRFDSGDSLGSWLPNLQRARISQGTWMVVRDCCPSDYSAEKDIVQLCGLRLHTCFEML